MFKNKKVLVYGLKTSGISACKLLLKQKANVFIYDDNPQNLLNASSIFKQNSKITIKNEVKCNEFYDFLVISPGISIDNAIVQHYLNTNCTVLSELELGFLFIKESKLIAITGTNGKTTTTRIVHHILKTAKQKSFCVGNIGVPLTEKAAEIDKNSYVVCEVSSFQLECIQKFKPKIAALLNISNDHLNRHKTLENYINTKFNVFKNQTKSDFAIFNADDNVLINKKIEINSKIFFFSKHHEVVGCYVSGNEILFKSYTETIKIASVSDIKLLGEKNLENMLCAICICCLLEIKPEIIKTAIQTFLPLKNRLEPVQTINQKLFVNDSKATNIDSTLCAVNSFSKPIILLLGGSFKGYEFDQLFENLPCNVFRIIAYGQTKNLILQAGIRNGYQNIITLKSNLEESVRYANQLKIKNCVVLLSPACASFDQYTSYEQRGEDFINIVNSL